MNILLITGLYDPYPSSGGGLLMKAYIDELKRQGHKVLTFFENTHNPEALPELDDSYFYMPALKDAYYEKQSTVAKGINLLSGKLQKTLAQQTNKHPYLSRDWSYVKQLFTDLVKREGIDVIQVDFPWMMSIVEALPNAIPRVFVSHELQTRRMDIAHALAGSEAAQQRFAKDKQQANEFEQKYAVQYDAVLTLTPVEADYIKANIYGAKAITSTMGVFKHEAKVLEVGRAERLVFMGSGNHEPNRDALRFFLKEIWPLLQQHADLPLKITGKYTKEFLNEFTDVTGVDWVGYVDDLGALMQQAISVVPVRIGSGIRIKILDSMRYGAPVVSTTMAAEGIMCVDGKDIMLADDPADFAAAIKALWDDADKYNHIAKQGYELVCDHYEVEKATKNRLELFKSLIHR